MSSVSAEKKALTLEKAALTKDKIELQQKVENLEKESVRYQSKQASIAELNKQIRNLQKGEQCKKINIYRSFIKVLLYKCIDIIYRERSCSRESKSENH